MDNKEILSNIPHQSTDKAQVLAAADTHCRNLGAKLTPSRRQVLSLVMEYPDVVKAYDVLNDLQKIKDNAAPPTVYRALDFLVEVGILHRAESLNGFVFCPHFQQAHRGLILSCTNCGKINEMEATEQVESLVNYCALQGFNLSETPLVLNGTCEDCTHNVDEGDVHD